MTKKKGEYGYRKYFKIKNGIIIGFFIFFPTYMTDNIFKAGVLLYFMCPTGFPVPLQIKPLVKSEDEENFISAFISLFMITALVAYSVITLIYIK